MMTYFNASIRIGGAVSAEKWQNMCSIESGLGDLDSWDPEPEGWGDGPRIDADGVLRYSDSESGDGEFRVLEAFLQKECIPFDRTTDGDHGGEAADVSYRPGLNNDQPIYAVASAEETSLAEATISYLERGLTLQEVLALPDVDMRIALFVVRRDYPLLPFSVRSSGQPKARISSIGIHDDRAGFFSWAQLKDMDETQLQIVVTDRLMEQHTRWTRAEVRNIAYKAKLRIIRAAKSVGITIKPGTRPHPLRGKRRAGVDQTGIAAACDDEDETGQGNVDADQDLTLEPDYALAYLQRALAYNQKGDHERAIADYGQAIAIQPDWALAYNGRGFTYIQTGDYDLAIADYDQAIALEPNGSSHHYYCGLAHSKKGDYDHAITDFGQALGLGHDEASAYRQRGFACSQKGYYDMAIADLDQALALEPDAFAYLHRGFAHNQQADYDLGIADFDQALVLEPDDAWVHFNRGFAYSQQGDIDRAIADYSKVIALNPEFPEAYHSRGLAYALKGDYDLAIADFDRCRKAR